MEGTGDSSASATAAAAPPQWWQDFSKLFQHYLDKSTPHSTYRWIGTFVIASIYGLRVFYLQGFYLVSYGLGIYMLNLWIGFLSPLVDPELEPSDGGPLLPTKGSDEFKLFIRRLPEFKFWYSFTKAFLIEFLMTFFSVFDIPVFWPILLCYWCSVLLLSHISFLCCLPDICQFVLMKKAWWWCDGEEERRSDLRFLWDRQLDYSAFRESSFGYGIFEVLFP